MDRNGFEAGIGLAMATETEVASTRLPSLVISTVSRRLRHTVRSALGAKFCKKNSIINTLLVNAR
jgi:hypothetical protein